MNPLSNKAGNDRVHSTYIRPLVSNVVDLSGGACPTAGDYILLNLLSRFKKVKILALSGMTISGYTLKASVIPHVTSILIWNCDLPMKTGVWKLDDICSIRELYLEFSDSGGPGSDNPESRGCIMPRSLAWAKFRCLNLAESEEIRIFADHCTSLKNV